MKKDLVRSNSANKIESSGFFGGGFSFIFIIIIIFLFLGFDNF